MTEDEIIEMARKAHGPLTGTWWDMDVASLERFANLVAQHERKACADIADRYPRIYRETKDAHEKLSPEPFLPSNFGFDFAVLHQAERIAHSIRARGQA